MNFEEWFADKIMSEGYTTKTLAEAAWNAGFYQGRLREGAWKTARLMEDELFGHPKAAIMPEGYVLVPVNPTAKMLALGRKAVHEADIWEVYQAMIQTAQEKSDDI